MKSVLIVGLGRFGRYLSLKFAGMGHEVMACDRDEAAVKAVMDEVTSARVADCTDEDVVKELGVSNFDQCYVCIGSDLSASLMTTALLHDHGAKHLYAKASSDIHARLLSRTGADEIFYPERDSAERIAVRMGSDNVFDSFDLGQGYDIMEIAMPEHWVGRTVRELDVRNRFNLNILALKDYIGVHPHIDPDAPLNREDHMLAMGRQEDLNRLLRKGGK